MIFSSWPRHGQKAADPALANHHDPVAHAKDLRQLRADHQDGDALPGELVDHLVDLDLGADVDAARSARRRSAPWGSVASHLLSTTFCCVPPDRLMAKLILARRLDRHVVDEALRHAGFLVGAGDRPACQPCQARTS